MNCVWIVAVIGASLCHAAIVPPPWADPGDNPCAARPGGWQLIYWPPDGKCYKIFTQGPPCPASMELTPGPDRRAVCRCPPGTALHRGDNLCHQLFSTRPCPDHHYFAPVTQSSPSERWGVCEPVAPCPHPGQLFHPRDARCYPGYTQGPCPRGQLLAPGSPNSTLGQCRCDQDGRLGRYYWPVTGTCHQHWTQGPCQEKGTLFLPEGKCGCHPGLPQYHPATRQCYQIGTVGPCPAGHHFVVADAATDAFTDPAHGQCQCKPGHVRWERDGVCYRPYTRGPCPQGQMFSTSGQEGGNVTASCVPVPCPPGRLWFPGVSGCHRVGSPGPCPPGQVVLFQDSVRTSVEGVSYQGMCGCAARTHDDRSFYPTLRADERSTHSGRCGAQSRREDNRVDPTSPVGFAKLEDNRKKCEGKRGFIQWLDGSCQQLYTKGPCPAGQWLVPAKGQRQGRGDSSGGRCECLPSFTTTVDPATKALTCQPPSVTIARYLNNLAADAA